MLDEGPLVRVVVEGPSDLPAVEKLLRSGGARADQERAIIAGGKTELDRRFSSYNAAARHGSWLVLRDADRDGNDCPRRLRDMLLARDQQSASLSLRLAVRSLEAWLLADVDAVADYFKVSRSRLPARPEEELRPKQVLVNACRGSRRRDVRGGMVPPVGAHRDVGPEYVAYVSDFSRQSWRPEEAATVAPSLARALAEIRRLVADGVWT